MDGYGVIIALILGIMFGPPILLVIIGISRQKEKPENAKWLYIMAAIYVLISGGICASMLMGF